MRNMMKYFSFLLIAFLLLQHTADAQPSGFGVDPHSGTMARDQLPLVFTVHFRLGRSDVDTSYLDNALEFEKMFLDIVRIKELYGIAGVTVLTTSSPEGNTAINKKLVNDRAANIRKYIFDNFPFISQTFFYTKAEARTWNDVRGKVEADPDVPMREDVLNILGGNEKEATKETLVRGLGDDSQAYNYIEDHILRYMRYAVVVVAASEGAATAPPEPRVAPKPTPPPAPEPAPAPVAEEPALVEPSEQPDQQETMPEETPAAPEQPCACPYELRVKTNGALLMMTVLNVGAEVCLGEKISLDLPLVYNPVTIARRYKLRTVFVQPEVRYWFKDTKYGHFIGLHGGVGWYNVALFSDTRYQDRKGRTPMWNIGLSYGYAMPLTKRLGLEFTVGAGYNHTRYDMFYNIPNGALYDTRTLSRWGITRAGINLIYNIYNIR